MRVQNFEKEINKYLSGGPASFISGNIYFIPNRMFMPKELFHTACEGKNLQYVGAKNSNLPGGAIAFDRNSAIYSTIGEFVERYSASFQSNINNDFLLHQSYNEISNKYDVVPFHYLKHYKDYQYKEGFPFSKVTMDSQLDWVKGNCFLTNREMYYPAELVYLPYKISQGNHRWAQTSTGLSAHVTEMKAISGGFLECEERNAFCNWWYKQNTNSFIKYSATSILEYYSDIKDIQLLVNNSRVKIDFYDLGEYSNVETMICFLQFTYKGKDYISLGSSARFTKPEAIIKSCLEAYQGIDFAILLCNRENWIDEAEFDYSKLDEFDKHFAYYNKFTNIRMKVPIYKDLLEQHDNYSPIQIFINKIEEFERDEILFKAPHINHILTFNLTTPDVEDIGYTVYRTAVPGHHLLTGNFNTPFLGFFDTDNLFINHPHPFP